MTVRFLRIAILTALVLSTARAGAQDAPYSASFLATVRRAADVVPGERATSIGVSTPHVFTVTRAILVEGGSPDSVQIGQPAFQLRFPRGWIMVDASIDRKAANDKAFSDETYRRIHEALRDARLVVVTHEHDDHAAGVVRSPFLADVQRHTMLTRAQMRALRDEMSDSSMRLDSAAASRYLVVDYDPIMPIAPGVVLIKAAGHTPGSQMVYVRLASGREFVLAGDVAWLTSGITEQKQKPEETTKSFGGEDRTAIAQQLEWLKALPASITVIVAHDQPFIDGLVSRGVLRAGYVLGAK